MNPLPRRPIVAIILAGLALGIAGCSRDPEAAKAKYLAVGENYLAKKQYGDAAIEFRNALRLDPRMVDAYYQLAQATLAQQDWQLAYASLEKAIELDPGRLDARLDLGRLYLAARQFDKSEDEAKFILKKDPNNAGAYQLLGAALVGQQHPEQALSAMAKVTELRSSDATSYVTLALVEISLNRLNDAEQHLKVAMTVDPQSTPAYTVLASLDRMQHKEQEAKNVFQEGIAKNPEGTPLYVEWATLLSAENKQDQAEEIIDRLRKQVPNSADVAIAIGDFYAQGQNTSRALDEYRRGLSIAPKNLEIKKRMQGLYLDTKQTQLAADLDRDLVSAAPKDEQVRVDHDRLLLAQGNTADAINELQRVVADDADFAQAQYFLAMAYWQNGEPGQAATALQNTLKVSPSFAGALQGLVRLSLVRGNPTIASIYAHELVEKFPNDLMDREILATVLAQQGHLGPAEAENLIARQLAPNNPSVHTNLGQVYASVKKWPQAQKEFETALALDPHDTGVLQQLADCLVAQNQLSQAVARVQRYVEGNGNDANGHALLGALQFQAKNYGLAQTELERAIQIEPKHFQAYLQLGKLYEAQENNDRAIAAYQKALDLQPRLAPMATIIGNLYLGKGDLQAAQRFYGQALDADPNFAGANANMAWIDAQQGKNLDVALGMAQKAKSLMPDTLSVTDTLGWVLYKKGNYTGAIPLFEECVRKSPETPDFHYHLGMALVATGGRAKGKEEIEAALRMKLDTNDAQQAHQTLQQLN